jgi:hypothetical protein
LEFRDNDPIVAFVFSANLSEFEKKKRWSFSTQQQILHSPTTFVRPLVLSDLLFIELHAKHFLWHSNDCFVSRDPSHDMLHGIRQHYDSKFHFRLMKQLERWYRPLLAEPIFDSRPQEFHLGDRSEGRSASRLVTARCPFIRLGCRSFCHVEDRTDDPESGIFCVNCIMVWTWS